MTDEQTVWFIIERAVNFIWPRLGLVLNLIGTLLIAFSFGKNIEKAHQVDDKGRKIYLASFLHPRMFKLGMFLLILGFLLNILKD